MMFRLMKMGAFASGHILKKTSTRQLLSAFKRTNLLFTRRGKRKRKQK